MKKLMQIAISCVLIGGLISCQEESKQTIESDVVPAMDDSQAPSEESKGAVDDESDAIPVVSNEETPKVRQTDKKREISTAQETNLEIPPPIQEEVQFVEDWTKVAVDEDPYDFHEYKKLSVFLGKYVTYAGNVNYSSIKANKAELKEITDELESNFPGSGWSTSQKLSYWINAYNVYTIQLIVDNYPTTSITKITAKPWHKKFIQLNGATYSLNQIENDIIRKQFNEPRIHFVLNCASKSCPVLLNKAYTPKNLYAQLTSQTKRFLKDTTKNQFEEKSIKISSIFDWYSADFNKGGKTTIDFINKYRTEQLTDPKVTYMEYSWDLNK